MYRLRYTEFEPIFKTSVEDYISTCEYFIYEELDARTKIALFNYEDKSRCSYFIKKNEELIYVPNEEVKVVDSISDSEYTICVDDRVYLNVYGQYGTIFYYSNLKSYDLTVSKMKDTVVVSDSYLTDRVFLFQKTLERISEFESPKFVCNTDIDTFIIEDNGYYYDVSGNRVEGLDCATEYRGYLFYRNLDYLNRIKISPIADMGEDILLILLNHNYLIVRNEDNKITFVMRRNTNNFCIVYDSMFPELSDFTIKPFNTFVDQGYIDRVAQKLMYVYYTK